MCMEQMERVFVVSMMAIIFVVAVTLLLYYVKLNNETYNTLRQVMDRDSVIIEIEE